MSPAWVLFLFQFRAMNPSRCFFLCLYTSLFYYIWWLSPFSPSSVFLFRFESHPLSLPLSSCRGCIPPLVGLPLLRSLLRSVSCGCLLFVSYVRTFVSVFCFLVILFFFPSCMATMSFAGYFLVRSLLSAFPAFSERIPGLIWSGSTYLVTTAGFVADQLM